MGFSHSLPVQESEVFGRDEFDALMASSPGGRASGWQVPIDDATSVIMQKKNQWAPDNVLFVRRLKPYPQADVQKDYVRVWVYDDAGTLRTTAKTPALRKFADAVARAAAPALHKMLAAREKRIAEAIASAPSIDRETLADAATAMTHAKNIEPIVSAVMLAATDPRAYVAEHRERCADFGIAAPIVGLHVIALVQHLPKKALAYFDWKEAKEEISPMLTRIRSGRKGKLFDIDTRSDAHAVVFVGEADTRRVPAWRRKAHLPLKAYRA